MNPMNPATINRAVVIGIAIAVAFGTAFVSTIGAASPRYSLKVRATEKSTADNFFVGHVLEQAIGKTNIQGDVITLRALSTASYFNKDKKKNSRKSWMSNLKADSVTGDIVTVWGGYKSADKSFELTQTVNRSR